MLLKTSTIVLPLNYNPPKYHSHQTILQTLILPL